MFVPSLQIYLKTLLFGFQSKHALLELFDLLFTFILHLHRLVQLMFQIFLAILQLVKCGGHLYLGLLVCVCLSECLFLVLVCFLPHRSNVLGLCGDPLLELHCPLVERAHRIVLRLNQQALRVHQLPIRRLLRQEVVVTREQFVVLGNCLFYQEFLTLKQDRLAGVG